jgi:hypothetical protein
LATTTDFLAAGVFFAADLGAATFFAAGAFLAAAFFGVSTVVRAGAGVGTG